MRAFQRAVGWWETVSVSLAKSPLSTLSMVLAQVEQRVFLR